MVQKFEIDTLQCLCAAPAGATGKIACILYPMDTLARWIEPAAEKYGVAIAAITGMDWQNVFSPWPAKGVPKGSPDFKGQSPAFLDLLQREVMPRIESELGMAANPERTLVGVSMSGLFALWQWMLCDDFLNIASLSGSFWYEGFVDWIKGRSLPEKRGKAYFLLGDQEANTRVKAFASVADDTQQIIALLRASGISTQFQSVPGNHYSDPLPRLDKAFAAIYANSPSR